MPPKFSFPRDPVVRSKIDNGTAKARILSRVINTSAGATCDELEMRLGLSHQTASAAISKMVKMGMLVDSGERRATRNGRPARIYVRRKKK